MDEPDVGAVRLTGHRGDDDLLSAGLGLAGLAGLPVAFADAAQPTAAELRRRAIQSSWQGIADLGPLGGYGSAYGAVPDVPGNEYQAFARLSGTHAPHRVLLQAPDRFDRAARCLVVAAASGSRGIYGAIALAGAWGLPRGFAVAYTDKGAGSGYFDPADDSGVALDGRRARRGTAELEFAPPAAESASIAVKHLHSGDHPEADWGRHVLQAARFGLAMLDRAYPELAPFTPGNTTVIATGLSNGGGAALQAAGLDTDGLLAGVVALEPNVHVAGHGRALYDYATEAALWAPCALLDPRFADVPFARSADGRPWRTGIARAASLAEDGRLPRGEAAAQGAAAADYLLARGWEENALATSATTAAFDVWRAVAAGYASAYLRRGAGSMPCGFHYAALAAGGSPGVADAATRAAWWSDASGIPPGQGVGLFGGAGPGSDPQLPGLAGLRALWTGKDADARQLHAAIAATAARLPRRGLPIAVVHGSDDGLLPVVWTSRPYVDWLRAAGRRPLYWEIAHAQHFDAFLRLPGFGERHVPLLPYGHAALDRLWASLHAGVAWSDVVPVPVPQPRGAGVLARRQLDLP